MASADVLLGAGLYESVRVSDGAALHGERHFERIASSAHALGLPAPERAAFIAAIVGATGDGDIVRVRLTASGLEAALGAERRASIATEPVSLTVLAGWYAPGYLLREHKLTSHFHGVQGRRLAQTAGYDDALLAAHDGRVGEASNANVAFLDGATLVTPSVDGLLPGVCRAALLDTARVLGLRVESRPVALAELVDGSGVLLTSSPRGLIEVTAIDDHAVPPMARDLLAALREGVAETARAHALALP
jgi:branched-subunit amino acid aminotransferase/4-amino-4-deoxychorismate lyase